jgi:hypothetical protein
MRVADTTWTVMSCMHSCWWEMKVRTAAPLRFCFPCVCMHVAQLYHALVGICMRHADLSYPGMLDVKFGAYCVLCSCCPGGSSTGCFVTAGAWRQLQLLYVFVFTLRIMSSWTPVRWARGQRVWCGYKPSPLTHFPEHKYNMKRIICSRSIGILDLAVYSQASIPCRRQRGYSGIKFSYPEQCSSSTFPRRWCCCSLRRRVDLGISIFLGGGRSVAYGGGRLDFARSFRSATTHGASDWLLRAPNPWHSWIHPGESDYPVDLELTNGLGSGLLDSSHTSCWDRAL